MRFLPPVSACALIATLAGGGPHAVRDVRAAGSPPPLDPRAVAALPSGELREAIARLRVLGSVLYVGAHPDDDNTSLLAALARGRGVRTAYLSLTRGDGGQNILGTETGEALGVLRTQELLASRRVDGAEQFFGRALDFGFSKSPEEALAMWGHERTLADVVWLIRLLPAGRDHHALRHRRQRRPRAPHRVRHPGRRGVPRRRRLDALSGTADARGHLARPTPGVEHLGAEDRGARRRRSAGC